MRTQHLTSIALAVLLTMPPIASASVGVAAEPWLLDQMLQAQRSGNRSVEADALSRLMLIEADNPEFKLHWLRMQLDEPERDSVAIEKMMADLCTDQLSFSCRQAKLIIANDDEKRRQALSRVRLLEAAGQYPMALQAMESLFGGVPEELSLRLYYYELMLKVDGKTRIAENALQDLRQAHPDSMALLGQVKHLLSDSRIERLSRFGLENVYTASKRLPAIRALEEVILLAPDDERQRRWKGALLDGKFWYAIDRADKALEAGRYERANELYRYALTIDTKSAYPYLGLSDVALEQGEWKLAIRFAEEALKRADQEKPLERGRIRRKLANLRILPVVQKARELEKAGDYVAALKTIDTVKTVDPYHTWLKAEWAEAIGLNARAEREYRSLFNLADYRHDARIAVAKLLSKRGAIVEVRSLMKSLAKDRRNLSVKNAREVAAIYRAIGEEKLAFELLERFSAGKRAASGNSVELKRDWAGMLVNQGQTAKALDVYRSAFVDAKLVKRYPAEDEVFTQAMLTLDEEESWDRRSLKREASELYLRDNVWLTTAVQYTRDSGTPGYSDLTSRVSMVEMNTRLFGGVATLRGDHVLYNVGHLDTRAGVSEFGTSFENGFQSIPNEREQGTSIAIAWKNDTWAFDIGTTPYGFEFVDWVGGLEYSFDLGQVGVSVEGYRRAKDSSLLAFAGQYDPNSDQWWGGVRRTGIALNFSWDTGGAHGVWSKLAYEKLDGESVADNEAWQWMGGYYHRFIAKPNHEMRIGVSSMYWHFDKDLSGYTLGHGGYYSPQEYVSLGVMALDRGRTAHWSWEIEARIGAAYAKTEASERYPIKNRGYGENAITPSESGTSVSYSLSAILERRLNEHWVLGATVGASKSEGYQPYYAMLYLRYSLKDWRGDLPMPPLVLEPYSKW